MDRIWIWGVVLLWSRLTSSEKMPLIIAKGFHLFSWSCVDPVRTQKKQLAKVLVTKENQFSTSCLHWAASTFLSHNSSYIMCIGNIFVNIINQFFFIHCNTNNVLINWFDTRFIFLVCFPLFQKILKAEQEIYSGCGKTKNCLALPEGCISSRNCTAAVSVIPSGSQRYQFDVIAKRSVYVSFGFSDDTLMVSEVRTKRLVFVLLFCWFNRTMTGEEVSFRESKNRPWWKKTFLTLLLSTQQRGQMEENSNELFIILCFSHVVLCFV